MSKSLTHITGSLTYTTGALDSSLDQQFERSLESARATRLDPFAHLIAGECVPDGPLLASGDPAHPGGGLTVRAHAASTGMVGRAVAAARAAHAQWRRVPCEQRCTHMRAVAGAIRVRDVELAAVISLETGKVRAESIAEVHEAIDLIETYCASIEAAAGFSSPLESLSPGERNIDMLRPYGVFGVIAPFNFPLALSVNMLSAALIAGNTVVVKPSQKTPWTGALLAELLQAGDLPDGVFNLIHGGPESGRALARERVDGIAFTGSVEVGRELAKVLSDGPYTRPVLAEMGGKNAAIVTARADIEKAVEGVMRAAFGLSGQKCSSCSRAIVAREVHDEFVQRLCALTGGLVVGDPIDSRSALGPLIDEQSLTRFERSVASARKDGQVVFGGGLMELDGYFVEPTIVCDLPLGHELTRHELFLPFLTISLVADLQSALDEANAVEYGLTAGIFSEDQKEIEMFLEQIEAGVVYVNRRARATTGAWPRSQSFCGWKASGFTGKGGLGPYYLPQFMREQSQTIVS